MPARSYLGELELMVLLALVRLGDDAYGVPISKELLDLTGRDVALGSVYDVVVDLRRGSSSFGAWWGVELSAVNHRMLWVPPGLAHGILTTSESADFLYKCTDFYSPEHERTLAWDDATLRIRWPLPAGVAPKLSAKDARGASFAEIEKFA